jgi:hypothetical protein
MFFLLLAQAIPPEWAAPIAQFGITGATLAWFMFTITPQLKGLERSQDSTTKAILLLTLSLDGVSERAKIEAKRGLEAIENKQSSK